MASLKPSIWSPFQSTLPKQYTERPFDKIRENFRALGALSASGYFPGVSYTNSVTRGESSPGTAALPAREYWYYGTGNEMRWVKAEMTWSGGDLIKVALYYSSDNEATYVPMVDEFGINFVITISYDGSGNITEATWGNVP